MTPRLLEAAHLHYRRIRKRPRGAKVTSLASLAAIGELAATHTCSDDLFDAALPLIARALGVERVAILEQCAPDGRLFLAHAVGWPRQLIGTTASIGGPKSAAARALRCRRPIVVANVRNGRVRSDEPLLGGKMIASGAYVRLPAWRPAAVLAVHTQYRRTFAVAELGYLQTVANVLSLGAARLQREHESADLRLRLKDLERERNQIAEEAVAAREAERRLIAYDLHDELAQIATSAHQHLQAFARVHRPRSAEAREALQHAIDLASRTVREVRRLIGDLRPGALEGADLATAIRLLVEELRAEGWQVWYYEHLGDIRLSRMLEATIYRVAQEALTNVRKHAQTTRVRVSLQVQDERIRLEVQDWGRGFSPDAVDKASTAGTRVGIESMRERIALLSGWFCLESQPNAGTRLVAEVPVTTSTEGTIDGEIGS